MYLIIVNYNNWKDTIECIESLINNEYKEFNILLVDNCSSDDSVQQIIKYLKGELFPEIKNTLGRNNIRKRTERISHLIIEEENNKNINDNDKSESAFLAHPLLFFKSKKNLGFAGGNNIALRYVLHLYTEGRVAERTKVFFINPDTFVDFAALNELNKISDDYFVGACQIRSYNQPDAPGHIGACKLVKLLGKVNTIKSDNETIDYIYGGALLTNVATLKKNGLLPEQYFLYWEEFDWCYNAKQKGIPFFICKDAIVYDKVGGSTGRGKLAHYYYIRNGLFFYNSYFKKFMLGLFIVDILRICVLAALFKFKKANGAFLGVMDFIRGKSGYRPFINNG